MASGGGPLGPGDFHVLPKDILRLILGCLSRNQVLRLRLLNHWFDDFITRECNAYWFIQYLRESMSCFESREKLFGAGLLVHVHTYYFYFSNDSSEATTPRMEIPLLDCLVCLEDWDYIMPERDSRYADWEYTASVILDQYPSLQANLKSSFREGYCNMKYLECHPPQNPPGCLTKYSDHWKLKETAAFDSWYRPSENYWLVFHKQLVKNLLVLHGASSMEAMEKYREERIQSLIVRYETERKSLLSRFEADLAAENSKHPRRQYPTLYQVCERYGITDEELK